MTTSGLTLTTLNKAAAIRAALEEPTNHAKPFMREALLLAMLTSAVKAERETAKYNLRELARVGAEKHRRKIAAEQLAERANHFEPD